MIRFAQGLAGALLLVVGTGLLIWPGAAVAVNAGFSPLHAQFLGLLALGLVTTACGGAFCHRALGTLPRRLDARARASARAVGTGFIAGAAFLAYVTASLCGFGCGGMAILAAVAALTLAAAAGSALVTASIPRFPWDRA